jgi:hypothetical protein
MVTKKPVLFRASVHHQQHHVLNGPHHRYFDGERVVRVKAMSQVRVTYPALSRVDVVERLRKARASLEKKLPISRMILFGSYAQDRYTAGSDIDVIVVYRGHERDDAYKTVVDEIGLPRLEARVYTEREFDELMVNSPKSAKMFAREGIEITRADGR